MGRSGGLNSLYNLIPMDQLLLTTKLSPPVIRDNLVPRPRLVEQMQVGLLGENGFARKLTLFSAPAGYGKSSLAAKGLASLPYPSTWLSLDPGDNDPARFLAYLLAAFQQVDARLGASALGGLRSPQPPPAEAVLTALLNDLAVFGALVILVLDDYHAIQSRSIHALVSFLLEHQPPNLHMMVLTREDPLLPVSLLLSRNQASQLRQEDLRFTPDETAEFLRRTMGLDLGTEEINELQRRTEGWPAGLQLAALSIQGHPDQRQIVSSLSGSSRFILDYLFEQVFERQPEAVQDFLLRTSVLERLSGDLCDHVAGRRESAALLEDLERANLFISPLGTGRQWYRYHVLFQELLRHRLRLKGNVHIERLHQLASQWYEAHGFMADAVAHALQAGDWQLSSRLIQRASEDLLKRGEIATLLEWYRRFPSELLWVDPGLCFSFCWPLILAGQLEAAEALLAIAEPAAQNDLPFLGAVLTARSHLARARRDLPGTIELSHRALQLLPESDLTSRSVLAVNLGLAYWHTGQNDAAEGALLEAQQAAQASGNAYAWLSATIFLGRVHAVRGQLHQAAEIYQIAIQKGGQAAIVAIAHLDLAILHYEWNELDACRAELQLALDLNQYGGNPEVQAAIYLMLASLECARGDFPALEADLAELHRLAQSESLPETFPRRILNFQVDLALLRGDLDTARSLSEAVSPEVDAYPFFRFLGLTAARLALAEGEKDRAGQLLADSLARAEASGWGYGGLAVRVLQVLAADSQEAALQLLGDTLQRSEAEGFIRIYADCGWELIPLLEEVARRGVQPIYVGQILRAMGRPGRPAAGATLKLASGLAEPLSERELEVLRLVAAGLSNREIAARLYVSPGTVKTHVHHICGKMGVSNRTKAVVQARDLGMI